MDISDMDNDIFVNVDYTGLQMHSYCEPPPNKKLKVETEENESVAEQDSGEDCIYCICRTSDTNRFMIGCDNCNEWYHGDCISITEDYAENIKQFFCRTCQERDSSLEITFKEKDEEENKQMGCNKSLLCDDVTSVVNFMGNEKVDNNNQLPTRKVGHSKSMHKKGSRANKSRKNEHRRKKTIKKKSYTKKEQESLRQCYGPGCVYAARPNSKYCSDDCGLKLAENRIFEILPQRVRESRRFLCLADERNQRTLKKICCERQEVKEQLDNLEKQTEKLEILILKGKSTPVNFDLENAEEQEDFGSSIYCVTCGQEIATKTAVRHMEKCFYKYECKTSFESKYPTNIEGSKIFCDYYNAQQKIYCKRLKVLCPEHSKEPKIANEVCGCPMGENVFSPTNEFCPFPKKKCMKHYKWEKNQRATLALSKMRLLYKMDDLKEQERSIRQQMSNRGGVLGLMLHQTVYHGEE